ncbi:MAG: glycine cleavage system protein H [Planctomycetia bacterium]|nr:glycine cleavage system protein H [Planctomycetia bacterium]
MTDTAGTTGDLIFMMGKFAAHVPTDRLYARNHMWALPLANEQSAGGYRFGFSAYAVRLLQDVYFLEWTVDVGTNLREKQACGAIESSKAESELYAPTTGCLTAFNDKLLKDPTPINVDTYGDGWLFEMTCERAGLLTPDKYLEHLAAAWLIAERTIKGQMNE